MVRIRLMGTPIEPLGICQPASLLRLCLQCALIAGQSRLRHGKRRLRPSVSMIRRLLPTAREPPPVVESAVVVISCGHHQETAEGA
jgi:hypothetical protein